MFTFIWDFQNYMLPSFREQFRLFISNPILLACIFSWIGTQFLKTIIYLIYGKIHSLTDLIETMFWKTGGMPSSHSALVTSLCTTIALKDGIHSDLFIFSLAFFLVTIRDAFGVRRSSGLQAQKLNELGKTLKDKNLIDDYKKLKEVNGHTPMEVMCGCLVGLFVALAFSLLK